MSTHTHTHTHTHWLDPGLSIKVWSTRTWRCVRTISAPGVRCLNVISAQRLLLVGLDSGQIQFWTMASVAGGGEGFERSATGPQREPREDMSGIQR